MSIEYSTQKVSGEFLCVNSCGTEIALEKDIPTVRPAGRIDYHILYVEQGICRVRRSGECDEMKAGDAVLFRPGEPQDYCLLAREHSISRYVHFAGTGCDVLLERFWPEQREILHLGRSTACEDLLERIAGELILRRCFFEETAASYLFQLLALLGRKAEGEARPVAEKRIGEICCRMQREYHRDIPLEEYAAECCLSLSRFSHVFKKCVGLAPGAYRTELRLNRAKELLLFSDLPVGEIGELVGYPDANYFARLFRTQTGMPPGEYRKSR